MQLRSKSQQCCLSSAAENQDRRIPGSTAAGYPLRRCSPSRATAPAGDPELKPTQNPVKTLNLSHAIWNCPYLAVSRERLVDNLASSDRVHPSVITSLLPSVILGDRNKKKKNFIGSVSLLELGYWKFSLVVGR